MLAAGMVDKYIDAHAGTQNLFDMGKSQNDAKVGTHAYFAYLMNVNALYAVLKRTAMPVG